MVLAGRTGPLIQHDDGCHKVLSRNVSKMFWEALGFFHSFPRSPWECRLGRSASACLCLAGPSSSAWARDAERRRRQSHADVGTSRQIIPPRKDDAERRGRHSHADRGNEWSDRSCETKPISLQANKPQ